MIVNILRSSIPALVLLMLVNSCTEQKITSKPKGSAPTWSTHEAGQLSTTSSGFNKWIGSPIDRATAVRWMGNFVKANPRASVTEYFISSAVFKQILSNATCVGVSLHYSLDSSGQLHIIPVGIGSNGKMMANTSVTIDGKMMDWSTQQAWINNYTGKVRSHFFGALTFERLLVEQRAQAVRINLALDDSGAPQMLLSDNSVVNPDAIEDVSSPCPPVCAS
ncbi:MAG TPA: hypothetical protein VL728_12895 [Cyclobacteriaceae bacterium]|jgi:hypothetical protein|nr:hypothetical protein [Cyclobacteriaceae bacterium]